MSRINSWLFALSVAALVSGCQYIPKPPSSNEGDKQPVAQDAKDTSAEPSADAPNHNAMTESEDTESRDRRMKARASLGMK